MYFQQILSKTIHDIWSIQQVSFYDEAYFDDETMTFENLKPGESIFEVTFQSIDSTVYLKLYIDEQYTVSYQFMTPQLLKSKAMSLNGTAELIKIIDEILKENYSIDLDYLHYYMTLEDDSNVNYFAYLNDAIFYFDFKDSTPFLMTYHFNNGEIGTILISPYEQDGRFDYNAELFN